MKEKEEYSNWIKQQEIEEQLRESKKQLIEESKSKTFEERLLNFYKEHDIFDTEYSENIEQDLNKIQVQLKDIQYVDGVIDYLNEVKKAEDTNEVLSEQISYFVDELIKINEDNREQNIAERLHNFISDFDFYNYIDNTEFYRSNEDNISVIKADIKDSMNIKDYVKAIKKIINEVGLGSERLDEAKELLAILEERLPKYEYHLGDTVYIGAEEYEIAGITDDIITLYDPKFPLFNKQMDFEEFEQKVQENYSNDHLKIENRQNEKVLEDNKIQLSNEKEQIEQTKVEEPPVEYKEIKENIKPNFIKVKNKIQDFILHPEVPINDRNNYRITDNNLGVGTPREKFARNIEAIKVLKKCEQENRYATPEEQEVLSKYVGWGGLAQAFDKDDSSWSNEYHILKELLDEEEYKNARSSTLTSFYVQYEI